MIRNDANLTISTIAGGKVGWATGTVCAVFIELLLLLMMMMMIPASEATAQNSTTRPKRLATNLKGFGIPFRINADDESFIEVQLYTSTDQGKNWRFYDRRSTDKSEFPFEAKGDGEYWFAIKTLNRNRQLMPEGKPNPELIITVDTVLPELSFDVKADAAGRIECRWKASDRNLKPDSLQILYQPIGAAPDDWKTVPVNLTGAVRNGAYSDQIAWWPETTERSLNVRLSIADQAGNSVFQERRINIANSPWRHRNQSTARTGDDDSSGQVLSNPPQANPLDSPPPALPFPDPNRNPADSSVALWKSQTPANSSQPLASSNQGETICENGVCFLKPQGSSQPTPAGNAASNPADNNGSLRIAGGTNHGHQPPLVGGRPVLSDPPNPELYAAVADNRSAPYFVSPTATDRTGRGGVSWESQTERWTLQNQTNSSTVRSPPVNNEIAPSLPRKPQSDNPDLPNPNPNRITRTDRQVIGESSTTSPNQYRGLPTPDRPIPPPEFLAGEEADNWVPADNSTELQPIEPANRSTEGQASVQDRMGLANAFSAQAPNSDTSAWANENDGQGVESTADNRFDPNRFQPQANSTATRGASFNNRPDQPESVMDNGSSGLSEYDASIQMIPSKRFRLNYAIDAIDPSGVARVDLWMTRDGGRTWKSWGTDPDNASPFPVEVDEEGRYGFRIVIHSKDGLTGRPPGNGDKPDIFVHVDTQAPLAQIVSVPYGRGEEAGRLVINYRVNDLHLTLRPISLYYSVSPNGPWTPIEEGLRNDGRYVWKPTSNVPDRVFLRLDAVDRAGNKGTHSLSQAIDVSGLVPRGTIHGVVPVGN